MQALNICALVDDIANKPGGVPGSSTGREHMQAKVKEAVITTAIVLAVIFAARRVPVIGPMVDQAISG